MRELRGAAWHLLIELRKDTGDEIAATVVDGAEPNPAGVERYRAIRAEIQRRRDELEQWGTRPGRPAKSGGDADSWQ